MRRGTWRSVILIAVAGICLRSPAWAQNREKAWELYPYVGHVQYGSRAGLKNSPSFGLSFAYHWTKRHEMDFGFGGTSTKDSATRQFSADLTTGHVNYIYNIFLHRRDKVVVFLTGGVGIVDFSTFGFTTNLDLVGDEQDFMYNYGAGIRFFGGRRAGLRVDARKVHYSTKRGGDQDYLEYTIGLAMVLGGA